MIWYFVSANLIINCQLLKYFLNVFLKQNYSFHYLMLRVVANCCRLTCKIV